MIKLSLTNKGMLKIEVEGKPHSFDEGISLMLNAILFTARTALDKIPEKDKDAAKAQLYDMMNVRMTAVLEAFAPEYEMHPNLTAEAIMKAENEILEEKVKQHEMSSVQK
jgi:hypothetical protein